MTERKRVTLLIGATALSVVLVALASRMPAPAPLVAGIGVIPLALLLTLWRSVIPAAQPVAPAQPTPVPSRPVPPTTTSSALAALALAELPQAALLCDAPTHRVLAANSAAAALFHRPLPPIGLSVAELLPTEPVLRALDGLETGESCPLVCASRDGAALLRGKLTRHADVFILTLRAEDADGPDTQDMARRRAWVRDLRRPLANLRAAAETIAGFPGMTAQERAAFDEVIGEECALLTKAVERLEADIAAHAPGPSPVDLHSQDIFNCLARRLITDRVRLNMIGIPLWLHGDSRALLDALCVLLRMLSQATGHSEFDMEALLADRRIYLDIAWNGQAVPAALVEAWLDLPAGPNGDSVRDLLDRHQSEPWSQQTAPDVAVLRIPLPAPDRPQFIASDRPRQPRPEMHDLDLMQRHLHAAGLTNEKLGDCVLVAFDCETTGLRPDQGDRLVQIGAVRIRQGRVLSTDSFERLIAPGMAIPPASTFYHGITDDMVAGKPPAAVVLPQFAAFAGTSVLVGHNVAFDLKFLGRAQDEAGITFRQPVLDTMILAALLAPDYDLSLDAVAQRLGAPPLPHRSALSDALLVAEIMVRLLPGLEARGIRTVGQACQACQDWLTRGGRA